MSRMPGILPTVFGLLISLSNGNALDAILMNFVEDMIEETSPVFSPTRVNAILCCEEEEALRFSRRLSRSNTVHGIDKSSQLFERETSQHLARHQSLYLLDLDCINAINVLHEANATGMFIAPMKWLILRDLRNQKNIPYNGTQNDSWRNFNDTEVYNLFDDLNVFPDSDVMIGQRIDEDLIRLIAVYRTSPYTKVIIEDRGYWKNGNGVQLLSFDVSSRRRKNLHGIPLKSCLVMTDPDTINHLTDYHNKHIDATTKINYPWILQLTNMMNATVSFAVQNSWGYRDKNGSWNGMIGMVVRREIDLGGTATFFTPDRIGVVQYISLYTPTKAKFVFRRPPLSYVSNIFSLPFRPSVWMASGALLLLVSSLLYLALKWEWANTSDEEREKPLRVGTMFPTSLSDNLLIIIGAVSQQGSSFEPRGVPPRIIILMLFVAVLSLYTSYSASIVGLLQSTTSSINTLEDLLHSPLKFGVDDVVYSRHYFSVIQDPVRKAIYEQKVIPKGRKSTWMSLDEGIKHLREGLFAFHFELGAGYKLVQETFEEDEKCGLQEIDYLQQLFPLIIIQMNSPYLELIRVGVLKIHESGLRNREVLRFYTKRPVCDRHASFVSVGLIECYAAFAMLGYGIVFSFSIFFLEILWNRRKKTITASSLELLEFEN